MLRSMVLVIERTLTLRSEAMRRHLGACQSGETAGAGYQRNPDTQVPEEPDHHILAIENVGGFAGLVLIDVAARFAKP